tara:strand:- start:3635 stop:4387 length:753 start_codon:yes stop_codon:yes gene_type:complete
MKLTKGVVIGLLSSIAVFAGSAPPVIIIDPGHGGNAMAGTLLQRSNSSSNNVTSPGGIREKDLTLEFSLILKEEVLREAAASGPRVGVVLTREADINLDFVQRAAICNRPDTACIVSIHFNAGGGKAMGSLAMIGSRERNPNYEADHRFGESLATSCNQKVIEFIPGSKSRGVITDGHLHGGLGSNFFFQLNRHRNLREVPKCFLEVEFIDNPAVERALLKENRTDKFRLIARALAVALLETVEPKAKAR